MPGIAPINDPTLNFARKGMFGMWRLQDGEAKRGFGEVGFYIRMPDLDFPFGQPPRLLGRQRRSVTDPEKYDIAPWLSFARARSPRSVTGWFKLGVPCLQFLT